METSFFNTTKLTLLQSLSQEFDSYKIENDLLSSTNKPTMLDSLRRDYISSEIDIEHFSNRTK